MCNAVIKEQTVSEDQASKIAVLNDYFRMNFLIPSQRRVPGQIVCTSGISALPMETQSRIWLDVIRFNAFTEDNDPHGEHDFGAFEVNGVAEKIFWKIDYYADASCTFGSEDPSDITRCFRVLTIMLASDY